MEKMVRGCLLTLVVVLSLNAVCSKAAVPKNLTTNSLIEENSSALESHVRRSREIGSILSSLTNQFRVIIEDIMNGIWNSVRLFATQLRDRVLRQLEDYSFSDVLRVVFDNIVETDLSPEVYVDTVVEPVVDVKRVKMDVVKPVEMIYRNPYSLTSLLNARR